MMIPSASVSIQYDNIFSPFPGVEWERALEWVSRCGFTAAELILSDPGLLDPEQIGRKLESLGLTASTISTGQAAGLEGLNMSSADAGVREATRKRLHADIDFSVRLGRPNVTIGLIRGRSADGGHADEYEILKKELEDLALYADKRGVTLNLEPINRYECSLIHSTQSAWELLEQIGAPENVGILYDVFHSNIEDTDMCLEISRYGKHFSNVHLADSNRRLPGEGHVDFAAVLQALRSVGYDGYTALEVLNVPSAEHVRQFAAARVRALFTEADR